MATALSKDFTVFSNVIDRYKSDRIRILLYDLWNHFNDNIIKDSNIIGINFWLETDIDEGKICYKAPAISFKVKPNKNILKDKKELINQWHDRKLDFQEKLYEQKKHVHRNAKKPYTNWYTEQSIDKYKNAKNNIKEQLKLIFRQSVFIKEKINSKNHWWIQKTYFEKDTLNHDNILREIFFNEKDITAIIHVSNFFVYHKEFLYDIFELNVKKDDCIQITLELNDEGKFKYRIKKGWEE